MVRPKPPGRSHDPASDDGARGMVVTPCGRERSRSCRRQNSAYGSAAAEPLGIVVGRGSGVDGRLTFWTRDPLTYD